MKRSPAPRRRHAAGRLAAAALAALLVPAAIADRGELPDGAKTAPCAYDLDDDAQVGFAELLAVLSAWGNCPVVTICPADLGQDGHVDAEDLMTVLANWGPCPAAGS